MNIASITSAMKAKSKEKVRIRPVYLAMI